MRYTTVFSPRVFYRYNILAQMGLDMSQFCLCNILWALLVAEGFQQRLDLESLSRTPNLYPGWMELHRGCSDRW
jgi:hypothetical protein